MKKAAIYVRVSTAAKVRAGADSVFEQNPDVQELPLRQLAQQRGWTVVRVYSDRASGAKENRPGLKQLMADARRGAFQVVLVWRFDRFARSVEQLTPEPLQAYWASEASSVKLPYAVIAVAQEINGLSGGIHGPVQVFGCRSHRRDSLSWSVSGERGNACPVPARRFGPNARCNWSG
jgi:hypothetical protein